MSWDPEINKQEAIETACHNAIRAMCDEAATATRDHRTMDPRLALAAALEQIALGRGDALADGTPFGFQDCIAHLRATAAPRREA